MAKLNKPLDEAFIPWEPIPRKANWYTLARVVHFEQQAGEEGVPVSLIVVSSLDDKAEKAEQLTAWHITFRWVIAYRRLPLEQRWPSLPPSARPTFDAKADKGWDAAMWEIVHSRWLAEINTTGYNKAVHHFVIASWNDIYEILAIEWEVEQLSEGWRKNLKQRQQTPL